MKRLIPLLGLSIALFGSSCRPEVSEPVNFPSVASFSPGYAKAGDTVNVLGAYLEGAKIKLGSSSVDLLSTSDDEQLSFIVTDKMETSELTVEFDEENSQTFPFEIVLNHIVQPQEVSGWLSGAGVATGDTLTGPAQLLITDFDGGGIRLANAVSNVGNFSQTQFEGQVQTGGSMLITKGFLGVQSSDAKGNYLAVQMNPEFVQEGTSGHVGEVISRSEVQNDRATPWSNNFAEYANSPLVAPESKNELKEIYLNFQLYKNGKDKGLLYAYVFNDDLVLGDQFRYNVGSNVGNDEWVWVSVPFSDFASNYGYGSALKYGQFETINKIKFATAHTDKASNQVEPATDDVQFYIDHIIITQGAPYFGHIR